MAEEEETTEFTWEDSEEEDSVGDLPPVEFKPPPPSALRKQRASISAECFVPGANMTPSILIPKSEEAKASIREKIAGNILFSGLDEEQRTVIINAVASVDFPAGSEIIHQGEKDANTFYVLEVGSAQAFVNDMMVKEYVPGGSFGELALLYNAPRAATIKAVSDCICWALDRATFRSTVIESMHLKRMTYEKFLEEVHILDSLSEYERSAIADVLEPRYYEPGELIIKEGDPGKEFFMLEDGEVEAVSAQHGGATMKYTRGAYFGELALLYDDARQATCTAVTRCKVVSMDAGSFKRLIGPLEDILKRNEAQYSQLQADGIIKV